MHILQFILCGAARFDFRNLESFSSFAGFFFMGAKFPAKFGDERRGQQR